MKPKGENTRAIAAAISASVRERMLLRVTEAEAAFEQLWTQSLLCRIDPGLHEALLDQQAMFHDALVDGDDGQISLHGDSLCRGWAKAIIAMQQAGVAEDAVMIGEFGEFVVAIGRSQTVPLSLIKRYGERLTYLRPREVAAMYMHYRQAQSVKAIWPDAEIVEVREKIDAEGA